LHANTLPVLAEDEEETMTPTPKSFVASLAAGAMALTSAAPAFANDRRDRGIDAGDVIAGAVILGGIAAIASAVGGKDRYRDNYRSGRYDNSRRLSRNNARRVVERCVRAAEADARRYGYRYADVTQIRDVDRTRYGWRVKGRLVVEDGYSRGRYRGANYDRNDRNYRSNNYRTSDRGKFTCHVERGRVANVNYSGIRGLR
jgi:hypothetical protein